MFINYGFGNDYYGNLVIENYLNLKNIIVMWNSLQNLNSLRIRNCDKLKLINTRVQRRRNGILENVNRLTIESS